jgi:hypothetical protein
MCPFAYQTSKWIRTVVERTGIQVNWRFFSLEEVNRAEGKKHPWEREWSYGWSMMRVGALLRREDMSLLDAWYERAGRAVHEEGHKPHVPEVARELLDEQIRPYLEARDWVSINRGAVIDFSKVGSKRTGSGGQSSAGSTGR